MAILPMFLTFYRIVFVIFQTDDLSTLHFIGTAAVVVQVTGTNWPKPAYTLLVTGLCRFRLEQLLQETPYPIATVTQLDKLTEDQGTGICSEVACTEYYIFNKLNSWVLKPVYLVSLTFA